MIHSRAEPSAGPAGRDAVSAPVRVPVGAEATRWTTVGFERVVLAVVRTVTTATRLLDVLELLRRDPRVQIVFTHEPGSAFSAGVDDLLRSIGARTLPWDQATALRFDLAVAASEAGGLHLLDAPVVVLPHGAGHHKYVKRSTTVSGYTPTSLLHEGEVVPAAIVLSHPDQLADLAASCPEATPRAVVAGDVCLDRLAAGVPHRERYRRALGAQGRRLVVAASTWGPDSLMGREPDLVTRLAAELPADEYRVALVLHPSVWFGHSPYQVRGWLAGALDAGLLLVPPHEGWRATLLAADLLLGDHGSLSLYGAAVGVPLALAAFGADEVVPGSPMALLGAAAPRLDTGKPLLPQVVALVADHDPAALRAVADRVFALPGVGSTVLRSLLYRLMGLPDPSSPAGVAPVPDPVPECRRVTAWRVVTSVVAAGVVAIERYPAVLERPNTWAAGTRDEHFAVEEDSLDTTIVDTASVVTTPRAFDSDAAALDWCRAALEAHPTARVTAASGVLAVRGGPDLRLRGTVDHDVVALAASARYALPSGGREVEVLLGGRVLALGFDAVGGSTPPLR
ncbi:hypothetical protein [Actinosynnema sp. NPDC020468]|uniref:hypothetical protein n=1 Tax=Actinosynnema sp. NPDC020468 TaxID=3154488 RepID=UPI00340CFF76